jgi:homoserine kinase type II
MAVYTEVGDAELEDFLGLTISATSVVQGNRGGVENSNFLLRTEAGNFILTLYEKRVSQSDLPFFLGLMQHLADRGINCPLPVKARDGAALRTLAARPAVIVSF